MHATAGTARQASCRKIAQPVVDAFACRVTADLQEQIASRGVGHDASGRGANARLGGRVVLLDVEIVEGRRLVAGALDAQVRLGLGQHELHQHAPLVPLELGDARDRPESGEASPRTAASSTLTDVVRAL